MAIPSVQEFYLPLLTVLSRSREPVPTRSAIEQVAEIVRLAEADRRVLVPGGNKPVYAKRVSWAMTHLKRSGHTRTPAFGLWEITDAGERIVSLGDGATKQLVSEIETRELGNVQEAGRKETKRLVRQDPEEMITNALDSITEAVADELLERVQAMDPGRFEGLVLQVLQKAYGRQLRDVKQTGGPGDGGIDGTLALDEFGLQLAHMQAKRWIGSVGRPEVQQFAGAIGEHRVQHGIFVTSGTFTRDAQDFARKSDKNIVLVDGHVLVQAMIRHEIGVSSEAFVRPKVDLDFFADGE